MRRTYLFLAVMATCPLLGAAAWYASASRGSSARTTPDDARRTLPLTQVILFNTGVGYFQRHGSIENNARIDLSFPLTDVNDLLKSLTVEDGNRLAPVSYDGAEPVEQTLRSFALDLTGNPTFGQLLNQARGEKVEVNLDNATTGLPATLSGSIVGMEAAAGDTGVAEVHHLNLLTTDGMRRLPLARILRVRFLNAHLDEEFRRALGTLAAGHNNQRRNVSLTLSGDGRRDVTISYVVESPIWKASYRLVLGGKAAKPKLQAWAIVENTSEEDWKDVRMALVSGRPITFKSDLSEPLFVPRPTFNAEVYASLKPPRHEGAMPGQPQDGGGQVGLNIGLGGGLAGGFQGGFQLGGGGFGGLQLGGAGFGWVGNPFFVNRYQLGPTFSPASNRLSYEELLKRRQQLLTQRRRARESARNVGDLIANSEDIESIAVDADRIGEEFSYSLDQKVTLPRRKSALLPVLHRELEVGRVSVYSKATHPRFPLHALRVKNTTGQHLLAGPLAVLDGGRFAGDARLPDLQPNEERLVSYAMDLGVEVRDRVSRQRHTVGMSIADGSVWTRYRHAQSTTYELRNRSKQDRTVLVEHPVGSTWKLSGKERPTEKGRGFYRFQWKAAAGKQQTCIVEEEHHTSEPHSLSRMSEAEVLAYVQDAASSHAVKAALRKLLDERKKWDTLVAEVAELSRNVRAVLDEQERVRSGLGRVPAGSAIHKRYLDKLDQLEGQLEKARPHLAEREAALDRQKKVYEGLLRTLKVS